MSLAAPVRRDIAAGMMFGTCAALIALSHGNSLKAAACAVPVAIGVLWWMLLEPTLWLSLFFATALLLPPLPIDLGNAGPHIAILIAACGLLVGMIHRVPLRWDLCSISFCALFAAMAASVPMALIYSGLPIAAASMARVMLFGISLYVFLFVRGVPVPFPIVRLLFWAATASAMFACLDFYFQFPAPAGYGPQFIWLESGVFRRAQGVFYEASTLGNVCVFFLVMIAVALSRPRRDRTVSTVTMLCGGVALLAALVLSYSRASLVNLAVSLAVLLWVHRARLGRLLVLAVTLAGAAFGLLVSLFPLFAKAYWQRFSLSFANFLEAPNAILSGRVDTWSVLTRFLIAHPWHAILGIGYKTLPYSDFIGQKAVADNTYLGMFIETGLAGFAALLIWNAAVLRASCRAARSEEPERSFYGTWMLCFWTGQIVQMFSGDLLTYWRVLPVYTCVLALAVRRR